MNAPQLVITFALPEEAARLRARLGIRERPAVGRLVRFERGRVEGGIFCTGMGGEEAAGRLTTLLEVGRPDGLLASGFAAGLRPDLALGDLFVADQWKEATWLKSLVARLTHRGGRVQRGTLWTVKDPIESAGAKGRLASETGAGAADMETAELAQVASRFGVPFVSIRAISDTLGQDLPVPLPVWFDRKRQRPKVVRLLLWLAVRPGVWGGFRHFVWGVGQAGDALATTGEAMVDVLGEKL